MPRIALIGDYSLSVTAHQAIPVALSLARHDLQADIEWEWFATRELRDPPHDLARFAALWLVPASPYENTEGAFAAIRFARETRRPFLGTCGGFQHALIEFARNVLGLAAADHAETNPAAPELVVTPLACSLVETSAALRFTPGSRLREIYGADSAEEGYRCNYGPSARYRDAFERAGFAFTAFDDAGEPRAGELPRAVHPFFLGTLFQPERAALRGETPPIARAFVRAATQFTP